MSISYIASSGTADQTDTPNVKSVGCEQVSHQMLCLHWLRGGREAHLGHILLIVVEELTKGVWDMQRHD